MTAIQGLPAERLSGAGSICFMAQLQEVSAPHITQAVPAAANGGWVG